MTAPDLRADYNVGTAAPANYHVKTGVLVGQERPQAKEPDDVCSGDLMFRPRGSEADVKMRDDL